MASLHSSMLLPPNLLSLSTPSSFSSTRITLDPFLSHDVVLGDILLTITNDEFSKIVQEHGAVEKAEILQFSPLSPFSIFGVMYDKYSGRSRRFAFVTMKTVNDANAVIEKLNGTEIGGREIEVNITEKPLYQHWICLYSKPRNLNLLKVNN